MRGFIANVIRGEHHASNGGLSDRTAHVLIAHPEGTVRSRTLPVVTLDALDPIVSTHRAVRFLPTTPVPEGHVGYMAGGAYVEVAATDADALGVAPALYPLLDRTEPARP